MPPPQAKSRTGVAPAPPPSLRAGATAVPASTPTPVETAVPVPKHVAILRLPPDAPPQILSVAISETTVHSGDTVSGTVLTTSNVASVEVRVATFGRGLSKAGVGRFTLTYPVGNLPFFVRGTYAMHVIARNTAGASTETSVPITVR
jgi:hypothetical protein